MKKPGRRDRGRGDWCLFRSVVIWAAKGRSPRGQAHTGSAAALWAARRQSGSSPPGRPEPGFPKTPVLHLCAPRLPGAAPKAQVSAAPRRCHRRGGEKAAPPAEAGRPPAGAVGRPAPAGTTSSYRGRRRRCWGWRCRRRPTSAGAERSPRRGARRGAAASRLGGGAAPPGFRRFSTSS